MTLLHSTKTDKLSNHRVNIIQEALAATGTQFPSNGLASLMAFIDVNDQTYIGSNIKDHGSSILQISGLAARNGNATKTGLAKRSQGHLNCGADMLLYVEHDDADTPKETKIKKIAAVLLTDDECVDSDIEDWVVVSRREMVNISDVSKDVLKSRGWLHKVWREKH